jgi:hypothetical protein
MYRTARAVGIAITMLVSFPMPAQAEVIECSLVRGNLCFPTRCNNAAKSERLSLDPEAKTYRFCPSRYSDDKCIEAAMQFSQSETSIVGVSLNGGETAARSVFLNLNTGNLTTSVLGAGGVAAIDFGTCELPR